MQFNGILLKESLRDDAILSSLVVTKEEIWNVTNATKDQPKQWTAIYYEGNEEDATDIARKLSDSLQQGKWYTNFRVRDTEFVIFPGKVFTYTKDNKEIIQLAKEYGQSIGIPESQLDWGG